MLGVLNRMTIPSTTESNLGPMSFFRAGSIMPLGIATFIGGGVDDRGSVTASWSDLVSWHDSVCRGHPAVSRPTNRCQRKLFLGPRSHKIAGKAVRLTPAITRRASSGDLTEATRLAARRINVRTSASHRSVQSAENTLNDNPLAFPSGTRRLRKKPM